jgi:hypothetical protein
MAHSPAAMIAARTNHTPQLAPARNSPIAFPQRATIYCGNNGSDLGGSKVEVEVGAGALVRRERGPD